MRDNALPRGRKVMMIIALLVAIGPMCTDMYLPALPQMVRYFGADTAQLQFTISIFLVGFALSQLIYGPLADRFGRKPVIVGGMLLFCGATVGCALAETVPSLAFWRFMQALGGCVGPVLGRAMIRDIYGPVDAAKAMSNLGTIMALAPAIAPVLGGYLVGWFEWQVIFWVLTGYGLVALLLYGLVLPETFPAEQRQALPLSDMLAAFGQLLRDRVFVGFALTLGFVYSGLFSFISGSAFVVVEHFGVSESNYGYLFGLIVIGYMTGTQLASRLANKVGVERMIRRGVSITALVGVGVLISWLLNGQTLAITMALMVIYMVGLGIALPLCMAGALAPFPKIAGTASSLLGFSQMVIAAVVGIQVGHYHSGGPQVMLGMIGAMGFLAFGVFHLLVVRKTADR